jgi:predicted amidohydrolase YtcJ
MIYVCAGTACAPQTPPADVVFVGHFVTLDPEQPEAQAIGVRGGRIVAVGSREEIAAWIGPDTRQNELPGVALPGFAEGHGHAEAFGKQLDLLDLRGLSKQEILDRVAAAARAASAGEWIRGRGWDQGFWSPAVFPTAAELDLAVPDQPVFLTRIDGHSAWLNSRALALAEITAATADPDGGKIIRDAKGVPTGILVDAAVDLAGRVVPAPTREDRKTWLRAAIDAYVRFGVTSVHDAGVDLEGIAIYKDLLASGDLPLRVYAMAQGEGATAEHYLAGGPEIDLGGRLTIRCFKALLDGALGSRGAQLGAPYADDPSETGLVLMEDDAFAELIRHGTERGFQIAVHAIGDLAIHRALDAFEASGPELRELRPRIEHVSVVDPSDISRFRPLGVIASMQPNFVGEYGRWALDRVGPERIEWVYPTRRIHEAGVVVASGTDFPASDTADPLVTLYSLVTRKGAHGEPEGGFLPDQRLGIDEALRTMTTGAAFAAFQEEDLGILSAGRLADMTVLSADPRTTPAEDLRGLRVLATIVGGQVVYTAP